MSVYKGRNYSEIYLHVPTSRIRPMSLCSVCITLCLLFTFMRGCIFLNRANFYILFMYLYAHVSCIFAFRISECEMGEKETGKVGTGHVRDSSSFQVPTLLPHW